MTNRLDVGLVLIRDIKAPCNLSYELCLVGKAWIGQCTRQLCQSKPFNLQCVVNLWKPSGSSPSEKLIPQPDQWLVLLKAFHSRLSFFINGLL